MRSMTGFGQAQWQGGGRRLSVEVRSVNQRFLDVKLSLPRECQAWEAELRELVSGVAERGKVDVTIFRAGTTGDDFTVEVERAAGARGRRRLARLQKQLKLAGDDRRRHADGPRRATWCASSSAAPTPAPTCRACKRCWSPALKDFNRARDREGKRLQADMQARLKHLRTMLRRPAASARRRWCRSWPGGSGPGRGRCSARARSSEERLVQEAALLAERSDVTEELVRLDSHLDRLGELLRQKRLGRQGDRLPDPGDPPRDQHHRLEERRPRGDQPDPRGQGRDREAARAGAERRMRSRRSPRRRRVDGDRRDCDPLASPRLRW